MKKLFRFCINFFILTNVLVHSESGYGDHEVVFQRLLEALPEEGKVEALDIKRQSEAAERDLLALQSKASEIYQNVVGAGESHNAARALSLEATVDEQALLEQKLLKLSKDYAALQAKYPQFMKL